MSLRRVKIMNVAVFDGKEGWFHTFGTRSYVSKKAPGGIMHEVVGIIELDDGSIIQLSTNRFKFIKADPARDIPEEIGRKEVDE
jgi:hypothetical protein